VDTSADGVGKGLFGRRVQGNVETAVSAQFAKSRDVGADHGASGKKSFRYRKPEAFNKRWCE
jgi:hypothetical protein